jgi:diguanylate cyclase (GGDEF)-like protein
MRLLIVDDLPDNIRVLSRMIADAGYAVSAATSGAQALKIAAASAPDLILLLLDIMMPEMDGYQTLQALQADPQLAGIPVIFVTACSDAEDEARGLELGAVDYITKPFKEAIVLRRVQTHLELKHQRDLLEQLSQVDGLTRIPNRRAFDQQFDVEWRRALRSGDRLAIAMIDVDHFKGFNDTHGHLSGDDCLRRLAQILSQGMRRAGEFVARYGGEEFVCLLPGIEIDSLAALMEQVRASVESEHLPHGASSVSPWVTISVGAALCRPTRPMASSDLIKAADAQLYEAKRLGRNRVCMTEIVS